MEAAADSDAEVYADGDTVRVSIVLENLPTAAYSLTNIAANVSRGEVSVRLDRFVVLIK